ncbi:MAG: hypothetical protein R2823_07035 [Acidimicrobiia bacterium]
MSELVDNLVNEIRVLSRDIAGMDDDNPRRADLIHEREQLRIRARHLADASRHPDAVQRQIEALEDRLDEIERMQIEPGWSERHHAPRIQDPGAYRYGINRAITDDHADEVASIKAQLERLRSTRPDAREG